MVELKYSSTLRPSLKFEMIGVSMISPEGCHQAAHAGKLLHLRGRSARTGVRIIHTELTGRPGLGVEMPFIISSATRSEQRDQASTTLLYFSPR